MHMQISNFSQHPILDIEYDSNIVELFFTFHCRFTLFYFTNDLITAVYHIFLIPLDPGKLHGRILNNAIFYNKRIKRRVSIRTTLTRIFFL